MPKKRGRGRSRGANFDKIIREEAMAVDGKLVVSIPENLGKPVGPTRPYFVTEIGVVVRQMAPLSVKSWG